MIKKEFGFLIAFEACFLAFCGVAFALPGGIADTGNALDSFQLDQQWTGTAAGTAGQNWYTGYSFNLTSGSYSANEKWSFCVDDSDVTLGKAYNYYVDSFNNPLVTGNVNSGKYVEAAYLLNLARTGGTNPVAAQAATWVIMFPGYVYSSDSHTFDNNNDTPATVGVLVADAEANAAKYFATNGGLNNYYLALSPYDDPTKSSGQCYQDYVFYDNVPEPSTLLLLGSGLVGLVGWRWRRK